MNSYNYGGSKEAIFHDEGSLIKNNCKESITKIEKTLRGDKNALPFSDGMFTNFNGSNNKQGGNLWKEILNFTQGRSKSYAISSYIISKKCKEEIRKLIRLFKASTDLILQDYEVFKRYIYEKKIIPMANRSDGNIEEDETYQMFIKLANNYDFYLKMKEEFHCKLNKKSPTKQWQKAIVPEKVLHKAKEKSKSKKKVLVPVKNSKNHICEISQYILKEKSKPRGISSFDIRIHTDQKDKKRKSRYNKKLKFRMSTVVKDFIQSDTYKILIEKRKYVNQGSKSKEDVCDFDNKTVDNEEDSKDNEASLGNTQKKPSPFRDKRGGIIFRTSTLQIKEGAPSVNVTPPPKGYNMPGLDSFQKKFGMQEESNFDSKSSTNSVSDSESPQTKRSKEKVHKKKILSRTRAEKQKLNFFVHKAPKLNMLEKRKMMRNKKTSTLAPLNTQFACKFNAHKKSYANKRDTFSDRSPMSPDALRSMNRTRISKLRSSRMVIVQNEGKKNPRKTYITPNRRSKLPTNISIPLGTISESKNPAYPKTSLLSPNKIPHYSKYASPVPARRKSKRPKRNLSNTPFFYPKSLS
ncbi:unnamed protein product [Moneuplotes crassus]|uniref:Uncharacterized protein n=1 Tax=Euplotes crassus TaxID=5936 RepID=A0AAD2D6L3_EUPCR|nr:unnamed protein product [Moneuplotes crassus]